MSFAVATIVGRLGADPETKSFGSGSEVVTFPLAVDQYNGKNKDKTTQWWDCECWSPAKVLFEYVRKGDMVSVSGRLRQDTVEKDGTKRRYYKLRVEDVALPPKGSNQSDGDRVKESSKTSGEDTGW